MKEYAIVEPYAEEIEAEMSVLESALDLYDYYRTQNNLLQVIEHFLPYVEQFVVNDGMRFLLHYSTRRKIRGASLAAYRQDMKLMNRITELSNDALSGRPFTRQYISCLQACASQNQKIKEQLNQIEKHLNQLLSRKGEGRGKLCEEVSRAVSSERFYAAVRSELIRAYCKARGCDGQAMTREAWQSILDETRHLVEAQLGGRKYEPEVYLTPDDLRSLIGRHAALYRCIDDTMIDADGVFDVDTAIDMHNLLDHWTNENYGKLRPLLACRQVIGDGLRGQKPRREATARKAATTAATEAQTVSSVARCFVDTSDDMRERVRRIVDQHYTGQPAALSLIEWALYGAQVIRVESEHRLFIEALVEWGIIDDPGTEQVSRMCSTMSTKTSRLRQKISSSEQKRIEEIREGVKV